jgi:membrane-associated phospholipid phosphatase
MPGGPRPRRAAPDDLISCESLRASEWLSAAYFLYLAVVCWFRPLRAARRLQIAGVSAVMLAALGLVVAFGSSTVRDWAPAFYVLVGYFLPGRFYERPHEGLERWLAAWDRRLLGDPRTRFRAWPRWLVAYLDVVYMGCFLMLPGGFAVLALAGHADAADRYWTMVAGADFSAFLSLTFVQTRPPWVLERPPDLRSVSVHRAALSFVQRGTIGANTFPSGHTAVSFAIAFALLPYVPAAGMAALLLSATIAVACIVGRYHYVIDVVTGVALACGVWAVAGF